MKQRHALNKSLWSQQFIFCWFFLVFCKQYIQGARSTCVHWFCVCFRVVNFISAPLEWCNKNTESPNIQVTVRGPPFSTLSLISHDAATFDGTLKPANWITRLKESHGACVLRAYHYIVPRLQGSDENTSNFATLLFFKGAVGYEQRWRGLHGPEAGVRPVL